jgi:hypothetical protein
MTGPLAPRVKSPRTPASAGGPPSFHLLAKPSGPTCNIDCTYCFFLSKEALYPNEKHRMSEDTLRAYIRQLLEAHQTPEVTVAWQGGRGPASQQLRGGRSSGSAMGRSPGLRRSKPFKWRVLVNPEVRTGHRKESLQCPRRNPTS